MKLPGSGGSYTRDKSGKNLTQTQKPTVDHPEGNRAREKDEHHLKQQAETPSNSGAKE